MAQVIEGMRTITALSGHRVRQALTEDTVIEIAVSEHPERPIPDRDTILFLRVTSAGDDPAFDHQARPFRGYVSADRAELEGRTLDALDRGRVQFVEGIVYPHTDNGKLKPCPEPLGDRAPGAETWLVIAVHGQRHVEPIHTVMARSEDEAASRAKLSKNGVRDLYTGRTAGGETYACTLRRLSSCPSC